VWDYDIPSEPILFTWRGTTPAIAITTKMGMIFLLDRRDGTPLIPVIEKDVPRSDIQGEMLSQTQPFQEIPTLAPTHFGNSTTSTYRRLPEDESLCQTEIAKLRYEGIYTPPSLQGSLYFPGNIGGVNWGGGAIDPVTGILYANTNREAFSLRLIPRHSIEMILRDTGLYLVLKYWRVWLLSFLLLSIADSLYRRSTRPNLVPLLIVSIAVVLSVPVIYIRSPHFDSFREQLSPQRKTPFFIERRPILDAHGFDCTPAPWGMITAVNLNSLNKVWEVPLGTMIPGQNTGIRSFGGPIVTVSGLVITAASEDPWLRIFDSANGKLLREIPLPVPAQSTPMTYTLDGHQFLVVAVGGHDKQTRLGDYLIAFAVH
jgi:quinoprotein glucose dehydrogenase